MNETHPSPYRIPRTSPWFSAWKVAAVLAIIGGIGAVLGFMADHHRFAFSYLFAFATVLSIGLGSIFLVVSLHITVGTWGVTLRRTAESLLVGVPVLSILFLPVLASSSTLYEWMHHHGPEVNEHPVSAEEATKAHEAEVPPGTATAGNEHAGDDAEDVHTPMQERLHHSLLESKAPYLNTPFWWARAAFYFLVWIAISLAYYRWSIRQDTSRDLELTRKMQRWAPLAIILLGLTLTFAAFDWLMSLEPTWYSTMFGVYFFASAGVAVFALVTLLGLGLAARGHLGEAVHVEHFHDIGKLLFGFICFWAYISFSQWMLIWYAGIPEEATYYHRRWDAEGWQTLSLVLMLAHFAFPFVFLMSRVIKRRLGLLGFGAAWMLVMHVIHVYWVVMPYATDGALVLHWMDAACLLAVAGTFFTIVFFFMGRHPLIPVGDPRLSRSLHHVQTT